MSHPTPHPAPAVVPLRATNGARRPIAFPDATRVDALCKTRANADNATWLRQQERLSAALREADGNGFTRGERQGYVRGVRWGLLCGATGGGLAVACIWIGTALLRAWGLLP